MPEKMTVKQFVMGVLNGMAIGVVTALISNAAISSFLSFFAGNPVADGIGLAAKFQQFALPLTVGLGIALQFKLNPIQAASLLLVTYIAAGNIVPASFVVGEKTVNVVTVKGVGDLVNMMLASALMVFLLRLIGNKTGSFTIVAIPVLASVVAYLATLTYPSVSSITAQFGRLVNEATDLQPWLMGPLVAMAFGIAVTTPLSSVGLALVTGVSGLAAGAANMGVNSAVVFLIIGCFRANKPGVPVAIFFGSVKLFTPLMLSRPRLFVPLLVTCAVTGLVGALAGLSLTTASAGFGAIGFIGPIDYWSQLGDAAFATKLTYTLVLYVAVPAVVSVAGVYFANKFNFATQDEWKLKV